MSTPVLGLGLAALLHRVIDDSARPDSTRLRSFVRQRIRHQTATLTYRQNEALLPDRGGLVAWSGTRGFGETPAQHQWRPRRRAQSWSAESSPGGPCGPGVGADGQHACALVSDTRKTSTERNGSPVEVVPFCGSFRFLRIASLSLSVFVCIQVNLFI